ncbi:MAG: HEPN domain-containing protein [Candidatus Cryosericum sp.]
MSSDSILQQLRQSGGVTGRWWTPESPNDAFSGAISINAKGEMLLVLERDADVITGTTSVFQPTNRSIPVLVGRVAGALCTLKDLMLTRGSGYNFTAETLTEVFFVRCAVFDAQIGTFDEFEVKDVSISLPILMDWANTSCCSLKITARGFGIHARFLRKLALEAFGNYSGQVTVSAVPSLSVVPSQRVSLSQRSCLTISFAEPVTLDAATNLVPLIETFLSLVTLSSVAVSCFSCTSEQVKHMWRTQDGEDRPRYVPMLVWRYGMEEEKPYSGLSSDEMFVTYADLQESNQLNMLPTVLARTDELGLALSSLVPEGGNFHSYSPHRFLNAAQALESLDNLSGHTASLEPASYKKVKKRILEKFGGDDLSWLKDKLDQTGNWPSLAARIQHVIQVNSRLLGTTVDEQSGFVRDVVNTRNFLVHLDSSRKQKGVSGIGLIGLTDKVEALARLCFLREIGFDDQSLVRLFNHDERTYIKHVKELFQSQN